MCIFAPVKTALLNIGDELLIGQVVNSNAATMARLLTQAGMTVDEVCTVGDDADAIGTSLRRLLNNNDAVLMTGGLGPTKDDITKTVLCRFFQSDLIEDVAVYDNICRIFASRGYPMSDTNRQQALVPRCCTVLNNLWGTAPGMWFETENHRVVVSLPGVPFEMELLMKQLVVPRLREYFHTGSILTKNILIQGIGESFLSDRIESWELSLPDHIRLAYLPQAGMLKLRLTAHGDDEAMLRDEVAALLRDLYPLAAEYIVGEDCETLPELVAKSFTHAGVTLATAESCTGGLLAAQLTALPGASVYFRGGVVSYSNDAKEELLGVRHATLDTYGAVSETTAREMAEGVRRRLDADYGVATTGIAGPGGGTPDKPVGTVWVALASPHGTSARLLHFGDRRQQTIERTCNQVYSDLVRKLKSKN